MTENDQAHGMIDVAHCPDLRQYSSLSGSRRPGLPFHTLLFQVKPSVGEAQMAGKDQIKKMS